jgi:hypothetical protein
MKVKELIQRLSELPLDLEVVILDGYNGGGCQRTINLGPFVEELGPEEVKHRLAEEPDYYDDTRTPPGKPRVVMGYGCY